MYDFDKTHWNKKPCPKINCRKKCLCGLKYVNIPAAMTESVTPEKGRYCNAIVEYESTGDVYIYSSEGIPVLIKEGNGA